MEGVARCLSTVLIRGSEHEQAFHKLLLLPPVPLPLPPMLSRLWSAKRPSQITNKENGNDTAKSNWTIQKSFYLYTKKNAPGLSVIKFESCKY